MSTTTSIPKKAAANDLTQKGSNFSLEKFLMNDFHICRVKFT